MCKIKIRIEEQRSSYEFNYKGELAGFQFVEGHEVKGLDLPPIKLSHYVDDRGRLIAVFAFEVDDEGGSGFFGKVDKE